MKSSQGQPGVKVLSHNYFTKLTSSTFKTATPCMDLKTMMNVSEHGNFATLGQLHWVYQTEFFVFIFSFNIFLAFTAALGNTLILIALHKVSSIHPPTNFFLRCLAMSCLLYTSPSPRDLSTSRMPSSA